MQKGAWMVQQIPAPFFWTTQLIQLLSFRKGIVGLEIPKRLGKDMKMGRDMAREEMKLGKEMMLRKRWG